MGGNNIFGWACAPHLCQGQCEGQGVEVVVGVEGRGQGGQGEGEEGGHKVHQVCHTQQQQQPRHAGYGFDRIRNRW